MDYISCEILTVENREEVTVGHMKVHTVPRIGEYIWFSEQRRGHTSWIVVDVAHWVGNGEWGAYPMGYQNVAVFVEPMKI